MLDDERPQTAKETGNDCKMRGAEATTKHNVYNPEEVRLTAGNVNTVPDDTPEDTRIPPDGEQVLL